MLHHTTTMTTTVCHLTGHDDDRDKLWWQDTTTTTTYNLKLRRLNQWQWTYDRWLLWLSHPPYWHLIPQPPRPRHDMSQQHGNSLQTTYLKFGSLPVLGYLHYLLQLTDCHHVIADNYYLDTYITLPPLTTATMSTDANNNRVGGLIICVVGKSLFVFYQVNNVLGTTVGSVRGPDVKQLTYK